MGRPGLQLARSRDLLLGCKSAPATRERRYLRYGRIYIPLKQQDVEMNLILARRRAQKRSRFTAIRWSPQFTSPVEGAERADDASDSEHLGTMRRLSPAVERFLGCHVGAITLPDSTVLGANTVIKMELSAIARPGVPRKAALNLVLLQKPSSGTEFLLIVVWRQWWNLMCKNTMACDNISFKNRMQFFVRCFFRWKQNVAHF